MLHCVNNFLGSEGGRYLKERNIMQWVLIVYNANPEDGGVRTGADPALVISGTALSHPVKIVMTDVGIIILYCRPIEQT